MFSPVSVHILSAFAAAPGGGNPAGVVADAAGLDAGRMQAVARRLGLPETAFVLPSRAGTLRLRFFTPTTEIGLCGHATVAAWALLQRLGRVAPGRYRQELAAGLLEVAVDAAGRVAMEQPRPVFGATFPAARVAPLLGLAPADLDLPGLPLQVVSTGVADVMVPVRDAVRLAAIAPDFTAIAAFSAATGTVGLHAFAAAGAEGGGAMPCRNFAPGCGIPEEAATGSAAGALACYLHRYRPGPAVRHFAQGEALGRPSRLRAELATRGAQVLRVTVSGRAGPHRTVQVEAGP